jgi:hypothetical protein
MAALRALAAFAMIGALFAAAARGTAAAPAAGGGGETFAAESYDWSVTYDDSVWEVTEESNEPGFDIIRLQSEFGNALVAGFEGFGGDAAECVDSYEDLIADNEGVSNIDTDDSLDTPSAPNDAEFTVYTYTVEFEDGSEGDVVEYIECRVLVEGEAVMRISFLTLLQIWDDALPVFEDLHEGIESEVVQGGDDDDTGGGDEDDTGGEPDPEPTRDVTIEDEDDNGDNGGGAADSGVDGSEYESPTYGYTLEWDDEVWEADPDAELVDHTDDAFEELDRLVLRSVDEFGSIWIEGKVAYDGDIDDCLEGEAEFLADEEGVEEFELAEDEDGEELTGETDGDGVYGVYQVIYVDPEDEDAEEFELIDYVECRELIEDEAVLVITFVTGAVDDFDDNIELVLEVLDTIELADAAEEEEEAEEPEEEETEEPEEEEEETEDPEEEEETEDPEEEEEETAEGGVDGNVYTGPTYGHGIEWDEDLWEVEDESSSRGVDTLVLSSEFGTFTLSATDEFAGDPADCYDALEAEIQDDFDDAELAEGEDGPLRGSDDTSETGIYVATGAIIFAQCLGGDFDDVTISINYEIVSDDVEGALDALDELTGTLTEPA